MHAPNYNFIITFVAYLSLLISFPELERLCEWLRLLTVSSDSPLTRIKLLLSKSKAAHCLQGRMPAFLPRNPFTGRAPRELGKRKFSTPTDGRMKGLLNPHSAEPIPSLKIVVPSNC
jgi:hypothetical protein